MTSPSNPYQTPSTFPNTRIRRLRTHPWLRRMLAETHLHVDDFIWPVFLQEGTGEENPIAAMPGVSRMTLDIAIPKIKEAATLGIPAVALFPVTDPALKDATGTHALNKDNLICRAVQEIKSAVPEIGIITDIALDPYTSHGHDGVLDNQGGVDNDATIDILAKQAVLMAEVGADIVAPSDMMDGRVKTIRQALEVTGKNGLR